MIARSRLVLVLAILTAGAVTRADALTFNLIAPAGINPQALSGFTQAASLWENSFSDNITVNLQINFTSLGAGILGETNPFGDKDNNDTSYTATYSQLRAALAADQTSADDASAVSHLQSGSSLNLVTSNADGSSRQDTDGGPNNTFFLLSGANAKALGLRAGNDPQVDAFIEFSTNFSFDFNPNDGIDAGRYDFVGIAAHEIGHALGFVSGVDTVDYFSGPHAPGGQLDLNNSADVFNPLDLFRYSASSFTMINGTRVPDLRQGMDNNGVFITPYFSLDGGATSIAKFATGQFDGDGRQASHWKDSLGIGIMDPTAGPGERLSITSTDLRGFDAIGYNLRTQSTPEPGSLILIVPALFGAVRRGRLSRRGKA